MPERTKKHTQTEGLKVTSVVREIKIGSGIKDCRISDAASNAAVRASERALKDLGEAVCRYLHIAKIKTIDMNILHSVIKNDFQCKKLSAAAALSGIGKDRTKKDRRSIAIASALRCFGKGCPLGKGNHSIRDDAKDALSVIAEAFIRDLGRDATRYTKAAKRLTIKTVDIASVFEQRG